MGEPGTGSVQAGGERRALHDRRWIALLVLVTLASSTGCFNVGTASLPPVYTEKRAWDTADSPKEEASSTIAVSKDPDPIVTVAVTKKATCSTSHHALRDREDRVERTHEGNVALATGWTIGLVGAAALGTAIALDASGTVPFSSGKNWTDSASADLAVAGGVLALALIPAVYASINSRSRSTHRDDELVQSGLAPRPCGERAAAGVPVTLGVRDRKPVFAEATDAAGNLSFRMSTLPDDQIYWELGLSVGGKGPMWATEMRTLLAAEQVRRARPAIATAYVGAVRSGLCGESFNDVTSAEACCASDKTLGRVAHNSAGVLSQQFHTQWRNAARLPAKLWQTLPTPFEGFPWTDAQRNECTAAYQARIAEKATMDREASTRAAREQSQTRRAAASAGQKRAADLAACKAKCVQQGRDDATCGRVCAQ
jgi:hypothetical protein